MTSEITGRRILLTGGSQGIGLGVVRHLAGRGASVVVCGRDAARLESAAATVETAGTGGSLRTEVCDISNPEQVARLVENAVDHLGGLDVIIHNASGFGRADDEDGWMRALDVDLMGTVRVGWAALPHLEQGSDPCVVHIGSTSAHKPSMLAPAYAAVKAALEHYARSQAKAYAARGVRVNVVAPGPTTAPGHFYEKRRANGDPGYAQVLEASPSGRLGVPEDIAPVVEFLISRSSAWVTGQTIVVDGGIHLFDRT